MKFVRHGIKGFAKALILEERATPEEYTGFLLFGFFVSYAVVFAVSAFGPGPFQFAETVSRMVVALGGGIVVSFSVFVASLIDADTPLATMVAWQTIASLHFVFFPPLFSATVRRFHDIGQPGDLTYLLLFPIVTILLMLSLTLLPGDKGRNDYGDPPPV